MKMIKNLIKGVCLLLVLGFTANAQAEPAVNNPQALSMLQQAYKLSADADSQHSDGKFLLQTPLGIGSFSFQNDMLKYPGIKMKGEALMSLTGIVGNQSETKLPWYAELQGTDWTTYLQTEKGWSKQVIHLTEDEVNDMQAPAEYSSLEIFKQVDFDLITQEQSVIKAVVSGKDLAQRIEKMMPTLIEKEKTEAKKGEMQANGQTLSKLLSSAGEVDLYITVNKAGYVEKVNCDLSEPLQKMIQTYLKDNGPKNEAQLGMILSLAGSCKANLELDINRYNQVPGFEIPAEVKNAPEMKEEPKKDTEAQK